MIVLNKKFIVILLLLFMVKNTYSQEIVKIESTKIVAVTVYDGWAQISRTFSCDLKGGNSRLEFKIPKEMVDLTRLTITANTPQTKCISLYADEEILSLKNTNLITEKNKDYEEINNKIKSLEAEVLSQQNGLEMVEKLKEKLLDNISKDSAAIKFDIEEWKVSIKLLKEKAIAIASKTRELEIKKWQLQKDLENLSRPIITSTTKPETPNLKITAEVLSAKDSKTIFTFKYFIKGPSWRPEYEIRYDTLTQKLVLKYFAKVSQFTSEDWVNSNIILSTVNLEDAISLPDAPKKFLESYAAEKPAQRIKTNKEKIGEITVKEDENKVIVKKILANDENKENNQKKEEFDSFETELNDHGIKTEIPLNNSNIVSAIDLQKILIVEKQIEFKTRIELAPAESKEAYRRLTFTNNLGLIILPGNANLYLNGKPLGKVVLPFVIPSTETSISYGVIQGLYGVKQIEELDKKESKQENEKFRIVKYKLNLRNFTNEKITFRLYEMIPVSKIKDVNINFDEKEVGFTTQLPGLIFQEITLTPNENKQIKIKYTMESKGEYSF